MEGDSPDAPFRVPYYSDIGSLSSEICAMCNSPGDNIEQTIFSIIDIFTACPHRIKLINIIDLQLSKLTIPLNIWTSVIEKVRASTVSYRSDEDKLHIVAFLCCLLRSLSCCLTSPILTNCAERESMNQLVSFLGEHLEASFWSSQVTATQKFYSFLPSFVHSLQGLITHRFIGGEVFSRIWVPSDLLYPLALFCVSSKSCSDEWVIQSRTKTIELYTKKIMGAKSPLLTNQSLKLLSIFIQTVTQEEWSGVADVGLEVEVASTRYCSEPLDAATMKALKKAPEGSSRAVSCLLAQLPMQLDVSSFVLQGAPGIALRMIKSAAASVRCSGLRLFENILLRSRQTDAFDAVLNTLLDALQDKSGLLSNSSQKLLVSVALSTSAVALPKVLRENQTFLSSTSADCIPIILTCLDKETDEGVKWQLSRALSSWLHIDPTQRMSDYFLEMVKVAIAKARPNLMYLLMPCVALARSLIVEKSANKLESLEALVAPLIGLLKECMKKPLSVQPEAALSLELLLSLAARLPNVLTLITIQKLFGLVTAHNSPLHTVTFLNTMLIAGFREKSLLAVSPKSDDMLLTLPAVFEGESEELEEAMLMQKRGVCEQTVFLAATITQSVSLTAQLSPPALLAIEEPLDQAGPSFTRTALFLALHPSAQIRKQTCAHIANTLDAMKSVESSVIESTLLTGLRTHIEMLSGKLSEKRIANSAADTHTSSTVSSPNPLRIPTAAEFSLFLNAILTKYTSAKTVTHPKVLSSQFLADILIIIGHPFVGSNVCKKLLTMIKSSTSCDLTVGSLLVKQTSSPVESMHTAGTNAILLLFTYFGGEGIALVGGSVTSELVAKLVACDLSNISADDLRTYRNPEGAMTVALSKLEVSEDDVKITNADRKKTTNRAERRGQFGADVVEDEDWAERVKQEKMKKLQSERAGGVADASVKARQQVNEIVSRVDGLLREAVNSLHCLQCLFESVRDHIAGKSISAGLLSAICGIIAHVLDPVLSHLKSDLLHDRAYATLRAITALIDSDLREFSRYIDLLYFSNISTQKVYKCFNFDSVIWRLPYEVLRFLREVKA